MSVEDTITQAIWDGFCIITFVATMFGAIVITTVNLFKKGWQNEKVYCLFGIGYDGWLC